MAQLVQCCLNGRLSPAEHPRVPLSPGQLAGAALAAVGAGADSLHLHPRDLDGHETLSPAWCDAAVSAVRAACPGIEISLSTGAWIEPSLSARLELVSSWHERADLCSVNLAEPGAAAMMERLWLLGIGVEAGLATVEDAELLVELGVGARCARVLVEAGEPEPAAACRAALAIDSVLDAAALEVPRLHHGIGRAAWAVIEQALARARDIRVGLEDVIVLPDGSPARDNAELVAAAMALLPV